MADGGTEVEATVTEAVAVTDVDDAALDDVTFTVGELFESYDQLERKLEEYKQQKFVQFWKRDTRTIEAARKRLDKPLKTDLKYYEVKFCCIHGGQAFKPKGKGRRNTS